MLQSLHVKNLALIDEIEVEFDSGLNILTGETGAGKSIILGSVHLALGGRYTADLLRKGAKFGFVELVFHIDQEKQIQELNAMDIFPEDGMLVLNRKLMDGRSVSKINGETVTQTMLKNVASTLIDIHGQHEHQTLLNKKNHMTILDEYMGEEGALLRKETAQAYKSYRAKVKELEEADTDVESRVRELSFLQYELQEIEEANLVQGEDEELEIQYRRMTNGKKIATNLETAYEYTGSYGDNTASSCLSRALHELQEITEYDDACKEFYNQLGEIDSLLNDFNREVAIYKDNLEFSDEDFQNVEDRLNTWNHLKGKYGKNFEDISEYKDELCDKITKLEDYDSYLSKVRAEKAELEIVLRKVAMELSQCRKKQGIILEQEIIRNLKELNFLDVQFEIGIKEVASVHVDGMDDVGFLVAMNPGEDVKPLSNVVSGGELSRIMLAIKTVMADKDQIDTLIFDEVDAGISGRTATKVGEKLAVIGKSRQVICITHLAQIASLADAHYIIQKNVEEGITRTVIQPLDESQSIEEITRILGGGQVTDAIVKSAMEMKELAKTIK